MKDFLTKNRLSVLTVVIVLLVVLLFLLFRDGEIVPDGEQQIIDGEIFPLVGNEIIVRPPNTQDNISSGNNNNAQENISKIRDGVSEGLYVSDGTLFFTERQSGNLYSFTHDDEKPKRLTNTTITAVYESFFGETEDSITVIDRYLNGGVIQTFSGSIKNSTSTDVVSLEGGIITGEITAVSVSPNKDGLFLLEKTRTGSVSHTSDLSGDSKKTVFTSPFSEWLPLWISEEIVSMQTKPSINIPGFLYYLNLVSGSFDRVLGGVDGLTSLPNHTGDVVLYSESGDSAFRTFIFNKNLSEPVPLSIQIIPEKCVWSSDSVSIYCFVPDEPLVGDFPDPWYRGEKTFTDNVWRVNSNTGEVFVLFATKIDTRGAVTFDAITPVLDEVNSVLYFIDKKDSSLWSLELPVFQ